MKREQRTPAPVFWFLGALLLLVRPPEGWAQQTQATQPTEIHEHVAVTAPVITPTREASGTAWMPPLTPMYGVHQPWHGWDMRVNGAVFIQALFEPRDRHRTGGADTRQAGSVNWAMLSARRNVAGGRFGIRTMFSAEPWTVSDCGSLSFLGTGEICQGDTVHDRQQPHDAFMELAVDYDRPLAGQWRWQIYAGLAGEPALGPPGYPHRASAMPNPLGPITHHWLDSTHVSYGVVTAGMNSRRWKIEASAFNGRAPDESRVDLDLGTFDSAAARLSFLPTNRVALQVSAARMSEALTEFPRPSQRPSTRVTASAMYHRPLGDTGLWATTVAFGSNQSREIAFGDPLDVTSSAVLFESSVTLAERHAIFTRAEIGRIPAHHLHAAEYSASVFTAGKLQIGYTRQFGAMKGLVPGIGATVAASLLPPELAPRYSGRVAPSLGIFFSLHAARHQM
jgi:hypothetical protein